jgi:hypothetical protein
MNSDEHGPLLLHWLFKLGAVPKDDDKWMREAEHFVADDVMTNVPKDKDGDWVYGPGSQENLIWSPPYPVYWIEYGVRGDTGRHRARSGALIVAADADEMHKVIPALVHVKEGEPLLRPQADSPDAKWYLFIKIWIAARGRMGICEGLVRVPVNPDGRRASDQFQGLISSDLASVPSTEIGTRESMEASVRDLGFIHNVLNSPRVVSVPVPLANKRIARGIAGRSRSSKDYRYRIIAVRSNQTRTNQETGLIENRCLPWHTVRGHWRRYDGKVNPATGKPSLLFGRLAGNYWIASMVRGRLDHGKVVKDYWIEKNNGKKGATNV